MNESANNRPQATGGGDEPSVDKIYPTYRAETYQRSYNHLINEQADEDLFYKTFESKANVESTNIDQIDQGDNDKTKTGLVYYDDCVEHFCLWDENYEENPGRYIRIMERLCQLGLLDECIRLKVRLPRKATENEILLVHSEEYIRKIEQICTLMDPEQLEQESSRFDAVYFTPSTFECALYACGSALELVDSLMTGRIQNGMAVVRPPGHHAMKSEACGYCIFNNVAIAAKYCREKYHLQRILIIDWDVHHGQATQQAFYKDPNILYVSLHRYEQGAFWPELIESNYNFCGEADGRGFNMNIPLNDTALTDTDYLSIWHNLLLPVFYEFNPELVLVSAGYDAAIGCPEGEMLLTPAVYGHFTHYLMGLAQGKVGVILEGGYCIESLADSVACTVQTLLGQSPIPCNMRYPINRSVIESVLNVIAVHRSDWPSLCIQNTFDRHDRHLDDVEEQTIRKRHYPTLEYCGIADLLDKRPESYPTRDCYPKQSEENYKKLQKFIQLLRRKVSEKTIRYDSNRRTCLIRSPDLSNRHAAPKTHPERPNRIKYLWRLLKSEKILDKCFVISDNNRLATDEELAACHSNESIDKIARTERMDYKELREYEQQFDSIYLTNDSYNVARLSIGALLQVVDCVVRNESLNGFACIRPPGHHAKRGEPAGFCMFNQVAIAARYAIKHHGIKRILIVDWDIHHGTQDIVMDDERILFISIHRYDHGDFYPENKSASNYRTGKRNIINIPWNGGEMGDREYLTAFFNIVMPVAYNFDPELVLVSSGFDAAQSDPLGDYHVSPAAYGHMTHLLCSLANGKIILSLEGGYHLRAVANSAIECIRVLLGEPPKSLFTNDDNDEKQWQLDVNAIETIRNVIDYHSDYWPCFVYNVDIAKNTID
ncbi:histone deacetylase-like protein [Euroglyphus maynei]|uniref:Histone deacetylase-like protein n=1 Tax=Euroglyphus maynei TaxID=6958 RepID=A0A1Y3B222_EURMA|nr:histone deacetylase-like protein [Euroglyphus maynei]